MKIRTYKSKCIVLRNKPEKNGYVKIMVDGNRYLAHRYYWSLKNGEIPERYYICHKCDNPACINTDHLFLGTPLDNHNDMKRKGRGIPGELNGRAKLTQYQVDEIRHRAKVYGEDQRLLAVEFGIAYCTLNKIVNNKHYKS
jgi:hypothetical protein